MPHVEHIKRQTDVYSSVSPLCLFPGFQAGTKSRLIQLRNNGCDCESVLVDMCVTSHHLAGFYCRIESMNVTF